MYKVYKLTAPDNRSYIGFTERTLEQRFDDGIGYVHNCSKRSIIAKAIIYYGWKNFKIEVLETTDSKEQASELERFYIEKYRTTETEFGFNTQSGGKSGYTFNSDFLKDVKGKRHSINTEFKMGHSCFTAHPFVCLENGKTYMTKELAEKDLGTKLSHIYEVCKGKRKHCKGYHFVYCENYK